MKKKMLFIEIMLFPVVRNDPIIVEAESEHRFYKGRIEVTRRVIAVFWINVDTGKYHPTNPSLMSVHNENMEVQSEEASELTEKVGILIGYWSELHIFLVLLYQICT